MPRRRKKKEQSLFFSGQHHYLAVFLVLVVSLFAFAFFSPVDFGSDITGFQVFELVQTSPPLAILSFFVLLFGVSLLVMFTYRLLSRVL